MVRLRWSRVATTLLLGSFLLVLVRHNQLEDPVGAHRQADNHNLHIREIKSFTGVRNVSGRGSAIQNVDKDDPLEGKGGPLGQGGELSNQPPPPCVNTSAVDSKPRLTDERYTRYCSAIIEGDKKAYSQALALTNFHPEHQIPGDKTITQQAQDCKTFLQDRQYPTWASIPKEAQEFPIAYSIVFHKDVGQVERLLRTIYQPQNYYCLHVDRKAREQVQHATEALSRCFGNVFIASELEEVVYASYSRLKADINCMKDLVAKGKAWKYLINLTGQVFPLKTNLEIVKILKIYNGANDIESVNQGVMSAVGHRYTTKWRLTGGSKDGDKRLVKDGKKPMPPPPHNIILVKGSAFGVFTRAFVQFVLEDQKARDLLQWSRDTYSPDEIYWATLNSGWINPSIQAPGRYDAGVPDRKPWLAMYSSWKERVMKQPCAGTFVHGICIFSLRDLQNLISRKELFANKFFKDTEPMVLDCLEEWLRLKDSSSLPFDGFYYKTLPFVYK